MNKGIYVLGTDTDVGKTFISGLLLRKLRDDGINAGYYKAVLSGAEENEGKLVPLDCKEVCKIGNLKENYENMVSYALKNPYSPHLACEIENVDISLEKIKNDYLRSKEKYDFLICEGSGGIICPISLGKESIMLNDIVKLTKLPIILVSRSGLGAINHTVLTVEYLKVQEIKIAGIILNEFEENNIIHRNNKEIIKFITGINNIVTVPRINDIDDFDLNNLQEVFNEL